MANNNVKSLVRAHKSAIKKSKKLFKQVEELRKVLYRVEEQDFRLEEKTGNAVARQVKKALKRAKVAKLLNDKKSVRVSLPKGLIGVPNMYFPTNLRLSPNFVVDVSYPKNGAVTVRVY